MSSIFDGSMGVLEKALDLYLTRHAVISDNIANAETPFYKARRVSFEEELQNVVEQKGTNASVRDFGGVSSHIFQDPDSEMGQDLNTVDMDREMAMLTKNDIQYSAATQAISKRFALLKYVVNGGDR